jgi:hypothetical protein
MPTALIDAAPDSDVARSWSCRSAERVGGDRARRCPHTARATILRIVPAGRLVVTPRPDEHVFEFRGEASYGALLQRLVAVNGVVPPG